MPPSDLAARARKMPRRWSRSGSKPSADYDAEITADFVRSILSYDVDTGVFRWKPRPARSGQWNGRYADKIAGSAGDVYVFIRINGRAYAAQRLAYLIVEGRWPSHEVDHRDLNKKNNAWENLRPATPTQNKHNTSRRKNNRSGFKGVFRYRDGKRWQASIRCAGSRKWLGIFETPEAAHAAYCAAAPELHGDFARG